MVLNTLFNYKSLNTSLSNSLHRIVWHFGLGFTLNFIVKHFGALFTTLHAPCRLLTFIISTTGTTYQPGSCRKFEEILSRSPPAEMAAIWRCGLLIKNLTPHYEGQFCVSFNFCFDQEPLRCL